MATASVNGRTPETVRREIESEREQLARAVEELRDGLGEATDVAAKLRARICPPWRSARSARASSWPAASARRCACSPAGAESASDGIPRRAGPHRNRSLQPAPPLAERMDRGLQALLRLVPERRLPGPGAAGRLQLAAGVLPGRRLPRRPPRSRERLRRRCATSSRRSRPATVLETVDTLQSDTSTSTSVVAFIVGAAAADVGGQWGDGRGAEGRQPGVRPRRDAAVLEDAGDRDRARLPDRPRRPRGSSS